MGDCKVELMEDLPPLRMPEPFFSYVNENTSVSQ
jgi:hypothetical protein